MTMLQTKLMDNYIAYDSDADVFMSVLLFLLTCGFSDTSKIVDFKACLCASIFLNHCYVEFFFWNIKIMILTFFLLSREQK